VHLTMQLNQSKLWLHIALGIILALALTTTINLLMTKYEYEISYEQLVRAPETESTKQATSFDTKLTVEYIWQHPSTLYTVIFGVFIAFLLASLTYIILNHMLGKD